MAGKGFWADAFAVTAAEPLSKEDAAWLDSIADKLVRRGLQQPAILFLETFKPVQFVAGQAVRFVDPIFSMVLPENGLERLAGLLERRQAAERLILALERGETPRTPTSTHNHRRETRPTEPQKP